MTDLFRSNLFFRQKRPDSANDRHNATNYNQNPVKDALSQRNFPAKDFQIEGHGKDNTYCEAQRRTHQRHDAIKVRENNRNNNYQKKHKYPDAYLENSPRESGHTLKARLGRQQTWIETAKYFDCTNDWTTAASLSVG